MLKNASLTFSTDYKGYATTQVMMLLDVRTGIIPFTDISTETYAPLKEEEKPMKNMGYSEKQRNIMDNAIMLTLRKITASINEFLNN
ncbi:MAG: hypothetical protein LBR34_11220 [Prevotella sp.]|nr:hypothetical protein [Prevotella sp.]